MKDMTYQGVLSRRSEIIKQSVGISYQPFELGGVAFDYEHMMEQTGYSLEEIRKIQGETSVGNTPLIELRNITKLARQLAPPGKGARIFIKDEAANPSGSFKDRRASISVYHAQKLGYPGVIAATSGNYGAAVASQAAIRGLRCIIVQEVYDSKGLGQPEILEKGRKCEALGAEVLQLTVGPELFYMFLRLLEESGYFNASLYTTYGIAGVETLGFELAEQVKGLTGKNPDCVVITHAGGGNVTGTARGLIKGGCYDTKVVGASVDLSGLHMASDHDFNRKSFTTGHTGFGVPFATWPDRADVPRNAARPLRYLDRYVTVTQGQVFYTTEMLAHLEGLERGPAGNTSLAAAFAIAQEMNQDEILVVQETEYTGAGKLPTAQMTFAKKMGIEIVKGDPADEVPGKNLVIPYQPELLKIKDIDLDKLKKSYIKNALETKGNMDFTPIEIEFLANDTKTKADFIEKFIAEVKNKEAIPCKGKTTST
jgi:cysteine synthase